jgi:hypothetical protein
VWTGDGFIMDNYGSTPLIFDIAKTQETPLYFWVRYYNVSSITLPLNSFSTEKPSSSVILTTRI